MASCPKCGKGKIRRRAGGRKKCKRCGFLGPFPVNPWGSCFDSAGKFMLGCSLVDVTMVHGICVANKIGQEGELIAHAWLEFTHTDACRYAIDPIYMVAMPIEKYRADLQVKNMVVYSRKEFMALWLQHNFPGPWEPAIKKYTSEGKQRAMQQICQHNWTGGGCPGKSHNVHCAKCGEDHPDNYSFNRGQKPTNTKEDK